MSNLAKLPKAIRQLVESFERLPGIGPKSAQRLVFYLLHMPVEELDKFAERLRALRRETVLCARCHHVSEEDPCQICADSSRDSELLCVVEQPLDVVALERTEQYHGFYHVLHGHIAPLQNIGPDQLFLRDIRNRLTGAKELILATNPTMEGEATALYIVDYLKKNMNAGDFADLKITRIGHGLPIGADVEYADSITLRRALEGRRSIVLGTILSGMER
ncbi:MAG TPA: recombination mediator RecR [Candidatus Woesebacteria bacterium]|nr:recombination mediator RecR [Candidatus Woesebacteria bacterium]